MLDVKIGGFVELVKQGKRVKAGAHWLSTHRYLPQAADALPPSYNSRIVEIMQALIEVERAKPSTPGQSALVYIGGKPGAGSTYKWLGKDEEGRRIGIVGVRIDAVHHLSVEIGDRVSGYLQKGDLSYPVEVPERLHPVFLEILARTPHKFIGQESVQASTGVLDREMFQEHRYVLGLDDAGRGTICGPAVFAGVLIGPDTPLPEVFDSKSLNRPARQALLDRLVESGVVLAYTPVSAQTVDDIGITGANVLGFDQTIAACEQKAGHPVDIVLIDGGDLPLKT